jgi:NADPH-dependent curcumin reductase CurA
MASITGQEIRIKQYPKGMPTEDVFELAKVDVPQPKEGELLVRNIWMSVDPYMRGRMRSPQEAKSYISSFQLNKPLDGGCVGQVIESKNKAFTVGEYVLGNFGWREYWLSNGTDTSKIDSKIAPIQSFLSVLGMTGLTAYVGLFKIGEIKEGKDTVFVSAASGAVGSVAAQIAKIKGCHVVGSAGSEEKVEWLLDEAKIDYAFNYKNTGENNNISSELKKACPEGIDLYFDNVGGKHLEAAIDNMKTFGRIVLCGMISQYNVAIPYALPNLFRAIPNRLRLHGFIVRDQYDMLNEFHSSMIKWINEGKIKWKETIVDGLENAPNAFIGLFNGENFGKMLVKIGTEAAVAI